MWKIKRPDAAPVADATSPSPAVIREVEASIIASLHPHISQREEKLLQLRMAIHQALLDKINLSMLDKLPEDQIRSEITGILPELLASFDQPLNREERANLVTEVMNELLGLGPLETLLKDESAIERASCRERVCK